MAAKLTYAIWILTALFMIYRPKIFTETLQEDVKKRLIQVDIQRMIIGQYPLEKIKR